ncbi:glutathione S-transferase family protein [Aureimonas endophytica]
MDGTGERDPRNPHPEGKVPLLDHNGLLVWESSAIMLHLADLFPEAGMSIPHGHPQCGAYLSWFAWYAGVVEPTMAIEAAGLDHAVLRSTFRSTAEVKARLAMALADRPYLMGDRFTAADLLLHSPYAFFGKTGDPVVDAWVDRSAGRPAAAFAAELDAQKIAVRKQKERARGRVRFVALTFPQGSTQVSPLLLLSIVS